MKMRKPNFIDTLWIVLAVAIAALVLKECVFVSPPKNEMLESFSLANRLLISNRDPWKLCSSDPANQYGTYVANGFISARIKADGTGNSDCSSFVSGLYNKENIVGITPWSNLKLTYISPKGKREAFEIDPKCKYLQVLDTLNISGKK